MGEKICSRPIGLCSQRRSSNSFVVWRVFLNSFSSSKARYDSVTRFFYWRYGKLGSYHLQVTNKLFHLLYGNKFVVGTHGFTFENRAFLLIDRETALLYNPILSSEHNKERVASVIAHELAHQWFGDLVTLEWRTDLWLNEGFATYVEYLGTDSVSTLISKIRS